MSTDIYLQIDRSFQNCGVDVSIRLKSSKNYARQLCRTLRTVPYHFCSPNNEMSVFSSESRIITTGSLLVRKLHIDRFGTEKRPKCNKPTKETLFLQTTVPGLLWVPLYKPSCLLKCFVWEWSKFKFFEFWIWDFDQNETNPRNKSAIFKKWSRSIRCVWNFSSIGNQLHSLIQVQPVLTFLLQIQVIWYTFQKMLS